MEPDVSVEIIKQRYANAPSIIQRTFPPHGWHLGPGSIKARQRPERVVKAIRAPVYSSYLGAFAKSDGIGISRARGWHNGSMSCEDIVYLGYG